MSLDPKKTAPRERILTAARELFAAQGIRGVGVEAIAEAAASNKMTLYRHFASKDELVAAVLQGLAEESDHVWEGLLAAHPTDPRARLMAWLQIVERDMADSRGCPLANAAIELPDPAHPARKVIEEHKRGLSARLASLCRDAGAQDPEQLADELFLLLEGARISDQSVGRGGPGARLKGLATALISAHLAPSS